MGLRSLGIAGVKEGRSSYLGPAGHLAILFWMLGLAMLAPLSKILVTTVLCLAVGTAVYPHAIRRILKPRWIIWMSLLSVPSLFFLGERDSTFMGITYSSEGLLVGLQIAMRFLVVLVAVQGFTSAVDITALAGMLERCGLQGLGFSTGVALNLLPYMQQSSICAWQSLRMRGGLRKRWWRSLRLLAITIVTNALQRAEEVALAAEGRAFSPEKSRPMPVRKGKLDWLPVLLGIGSIIGMIML